MWPLDLLKGVIRLGRRSGPLLNKLEHVFTLGTSADLGGHEHLIPVVLVSREVVLLKVKLVGQYRVT